MKTGLFIFHRDLRIEDNTGLNLAQQECDQVIPCFIVEQQQVEKNSYASNALLHFMVGSLTELDHELQKHKSALHGYYGNTTAIVSDLIEKHQINAVYSNRDYTPFAQKRDQEILTLCKQKSVEFTQTADALLCEPEQISKNDGKPYTIFTPFFRRAAMQSIAKPETSKKNTLICVDGSTKAWERIEYTSKNSFCLQGGRKEGLRLLKNACKLNAYKEERDIPSLDATSKLSAHHKFGTVSIRESYHTLKNALGFEHELIRQLYWRDFFTHIAFHFSNVFGHSFNPKYEHIAWNSDKKLFAAWSEAKTGFPLVDAGIRELVATGYMHNRVRMVTASFLTKDLHIDWRLGEQFFAQHLVDYDPCVNNGSWQWAASTGCDAQPYFRIFNPWRQQERFDPECAYIKKWLPELQELTPKEIHALGTQRPLTPIDYPTPLVDHKEASMHAKALFSTAARNT